MLIQDVPLVAYRVYIAALSAIAEQNTEMNLLQNAVRIGTTPLLVSYTPAASLGPYPGLFR
jgi:hypothetical protein